MIKGVRLPEWVLQKIKETFVLCFLQTDSLWIFGSRADLSKKGGDIDLYVETDLENYDIAIDHKLKFVRELEKAIGEQKIDVVLNLRSSSTHLRIYDVATTEGIKII